MSFRENVATQLDEASEFYKAAIMYVEAAEEANKEKKPPQKIQDFRT